jgi:N-acetylneuraminic acid mutarotase
VLLLLTGTLLVYSRPAASTKVSPRTLTFAQRVSYQRAIEEVYWLHRIWPKDNPQPKPTLAAIVSEAQLEQKVKDYLLKSQLITYQRQSPITASELQAEMERMAAHTKQPEALRELFEALGNDPFVIAECLARRLLAERRITQLYRHDQEVDAAFKQPWLPKAETQVSVTLATVSANYTLPVIASPSGGCTDDTWTPTSLTNAPSARNYHTAVWTGSEMIIWGGWNGPPLNTGGRYDPTTDSWTATSTANAPTARQIHTAVWTGSEMIVWGGFDNMPRYTNTGGRYNPVTDSWTATNSVAAPSGRTVREVVWTGSEMIIWGGYDGTLNVNTGGRYNPSTDNWTATSTTNAPTARSGNTAVWTGSELIVWGASGNIPDTGGRYNPSTNSWTATSTNEVPSSGNNHTAVWTGTEMIVWGGSGFPGPVNTGGRYDPSTDSWTATSTIAPAGRIVHTAVWTGTEMIVWGGQNPNNDFDTGGRYNPATDSWTPTSTASTPAARHTHTAVWTDSEMIVWGGETFNFTLLNTGGRYCAQSGASTPTPTPNLCSVIDSWPQCGSVVVGTAPTDFVVHLGNGVDPVSLQASDFMVNGTPANSVTILSGFVQLTFHFDTSPAVQGQNTMHIPAGAFFCSQGTVQEFTCTFTYQASTPTPTPSPTATPTLTPRPSPTPRVAPTPRVRPTPHPHP